mmetsp:Transcript_38866/g.44365  ORF Transcript_38866/g.44365 Transcript_38866/m.44365 type:complete len:125 (-) Transcript_38866:284-658(-)
MFAVRASITKASCRHIVQRRSMGGGPKPEWTGIDAKVRAVFPEDWQLAGAILGGYFSLYFLSTIGGKKKQEEPAKLAPATPTPAPTVTGVPSVNSPEFEHYIASDTFEKMLSNEAQLTAWIGNK